MEEKMKILIVEDDKTLAEEIGGFLERWGYETVEAQDFAALLPEIVKTHPHLVLMDINLPYYDGFYWCRKLRMVSEVPVIFISSRSDDRDKIMAITQGGDDYVEKPFRLEFLKAKVEAILRRTYEYRVREQVFLREGMYFDGAAQLVFFQGKEVELTKSERKIFAKLMECRPDVVTREELMMELWSTDEYISDGTLTTVVSRLRSKLKAACGDEILQTRKGQGYWIP